MTQDRNPRPIFTLRIQAKPGIADIHALRALLKTLLRRHGFRCVDVTEGETLPIKEEIP